MARRHLALRGRLVHAALAALLELEVLDGVGDVQTLGRPLQFVERLAQQLARRADEGAALQVLLVAGRLLDRALAQLGVARETVFVGNAVKHFKFELRGKRRIHKTPAQQEAAACLHWLESEIELVDPAALVALGATAARQLMGTAVAVTRERGRWLERSDGRKVLITLHPSALLRMEPADKAAAYAAWVADLKHAAKHFASSDK